MYRDLKGNGFGDIVNFELIRRDWKVDHLRARPNDRMVAHTGFITVAKRVSEARDPEAEMPDEDTEPVENEME
jgi:tRNA (adenine57-N1/adenine58-N1)-methyltransferase catalytic subunit